MQLALFSEGPNRAARSEAVKPRVDADKAITGDQIHTRSVQIDSADLGLADLRGSGATLQRVIGNEALIDTAQRLQKSL